MQWTARHRSPLRFRGILAAGTVHEIGSMDEPVVFYASRIQTIGSVDPGEWMPCATPITPTTC